MVIMIKKESSINHNNVDYNGKLIFTSITIGLMVILLSI